MGSDSSLGLATPTQGSPLLPPERQKFSSLDNGSRVGPAPGRDPQQVRC